MANPQVSRWAVEYIIHYYHGNECNCGSYHPELHGPFSAVFLLVVIAETDGQAEKIMPQPTLMCLMFLQRPCHAIPSPIATMLVLTAPINEYFPVQRDT